MPHDPHYLSREWKETRLVVLERDNYLCAVPGCPEIASVVDHIVSRRNGGTDELKNLRSLCRMHDNQIREQRTGRRGRGGKLPSVCDVNGHPLDPAHPWFRSKKQ